MGGYAWGMSYEGEMTFGSFCPYPGLPPPVEVGLVTTAPRKCAYLPQREAMLRAFYAGRMPGMLFHEFLNAGFRRAGRIVYQPVCSGCRECKPLRVDVGKFTPNKSMRRCRKRNEDLVVEVREPKLTGEKFELYRKYLRERHDAGGDGAIEGKMEDDKQSLEEFLYQSPVDTVEFMYRDASGRLLAVGICDVCRLSVSSVYFYFDPDESRRGLGNFGALVELDYAARLRIPHWYLGYWVKGCAGDGV